jgi:hypothetical protein
VYLHDGYIPLTMRSVMQVTALLPNSCPQRPQEPIHDVSRLRRRFSISSPYLGASVKSMASQFAIFEIAIVRWAVLLPVLHEAQACGVGLETGISTEGAHTRRPDKEWIKIW